MQAQEFKNFNPAFYAIRKVDPETGEVDISLPLFAQMQWMNLEHPGWRVTSDGMSIVELRDIDETEETEGVRYAVVGHVAVIDEQGRRLLSVPVSAPFRGLEAGEVVEAFTSGAQLALEMLGYGGKSIRPEHWNEYFNLTANKEQTPQMQAPSLALENPVAVSSAPQETSVVEVSLVDPHKLDHNVSDKEMRMQCIALLKHAFQQQKLPPVLFKKIPDFDPNKQSDWFKVLDYVAQANTGGNIWNALDAQQKFALWCNLFQKFK